MLARDQEQSATKERCFVRHHAASNGFVSSVTKTHPAVDKQVLLHALKIQGRKVEVLISDFGCSGSQILQPLIVLTDAQSLCCLK